MPQEIPRIPRVGIRLIFAPDRAGSDQEATHACAGHAEQGSHERHAGTEFAGGRHARQPGDTSAAKRAVQDRLGLIICRVGHRHVPCGQIPGDVLEKTEPQPPCPPFNPLALTARVVPHRQLPSNKPESELFRQRGHELAVVTGGRSQIMLRVGDD